MAIALATYNFIIKYRAGKINPINALLRRPLGAGGSPERRYYTTTAPKDFKNVRPLTQNKYPIRCTV